MNAKVWLATVAAVGAIPFRSRPAEPRTPRGVVSSSADWNCFFGNLHSHSEVSDGVDSPVDACEWADDESDLSFLCLGEHNHKTDNAEMQIVVAAADAATSAEFIALVGQEFSTLPESGGNHVNVYDVSTAIPVGVNNDYRRLF